MHLETLTVKTRINDNDDNNNNNKNDNVGIVCYAAASKGCVNPEWGDPKSSLINRRGVVSKQCVTIGNAASSKWIFVPIHRMLAR